MSYMCVRGNHVCYACGACMPEITYPRCERCGDEIDSNVYYDDLHDALCEHCLLALHRRDDD